MNFGNQVIRRCLTSLNPLTTKWIFMRLQLILLSLFLLILQLHAHDLKAQKLTLNVNNMSLEYVLKKMAVQTSYDFLYNPDILKKNALPVTIDSRNIPLNDALVSIFEQQPMLSYTIDQKTVIIRPKRQQDTAGDEVKEVMQERIISGRVVSDNNEPLPGVSVLIRGTNNGTVTDEKGEFTLSVPNDNSTLHFSFVGYASQEIPVSGQTEISVILEQISSDLDEIVVVGYGEMSRRNVVGAVGNISGDEIKDRPTPNVTRALQGQIPGLNILPTDGKPNHGGGLTIRGQSNNFKARRIGGGEHSNSLGQGGGPLILIDGIEGDMNLVNPDDIKDVTVLKDASSAALYGARGAFGVILITTKTPQQGVTRINYSGFSSLLRRTVIWEDNIVDDPVQWVEGFRESYLNSSPTSTVPAMMNNYFPYSDQWFEELKARQADPTMDNYAIDANGNYVYYGNTNWLREFYKPHNFSTTHALNIQGAQENVDYFLSGRYYSQDGIYKVGDEKFQRFNARAKGGIQLKPWLKLENNTAIVNNSYKQPMVHYGQNVVGRQLDLFGFPVATIRNPDGSWTQTAARTSYAAFAEGTSWQNNPYMEVSTTTALNADIIPSILKIRGDFTYRAIRNGRERLENLYTYNTGVNVSGQDYEQSSFEDWRYVTDYMSSNIYATYTPTFNEDHDFNIVGGWNLEDHNYRNQKTYRTGNLYPTKPGFTLMDGEYYSTTSGGYSWGLIGLFSRVNYAYKGRYLGELSARYDGATKFPPNSQWGFFPSLSLGWIVSDEPWMEPVKKDWLNTVKIRANVGSLGNANINPYQFMEVLNLSRSSVIIDGNRVPYTTAPGLIPDDLTWEKVVSYNLGLDMNFLNNRLGFIGDIFRRDTDDLYTVGPNLPHVLGSSAPYGNYASLKTTGWELTLNWRDSFTLATKPFNYSVRAMVWDSRSWVTDYFNEIGDLTTYYKGMEIGEMWGFLTDGIYASNAEALNGPSYNFFRNGEVDGVAYAGDLKFVDVDGDGQMTRGNRTLHNHGDMVIIGNTSPRYNFSLNTSGNWNGFGLSLLWQGIGKRDWYPWTETGFFWGQHNRAYNHLMKTQTGDNIVQIDKSTDNWVVTNMDKNPYWSRKVSLAANRNDGPLTWENTHYLQSIAYIRLKNITVDYTFNQSVAKRLGMESLRVYLSGENLFTYSPMFKNTKMFDPEVIESGDSDFAASTTSGLNGTGNGYSYPMLKNFTVGLNLTF